MPNLNLLEFGLRVYFSQEFLRAKTSPSLLLPAPFYLSIIYLSISSTYLFLDEATLG